METTRTAAVTTRDVVIPAAISTVWLALAPCTALYLIHKRNLLRSNFQGNQIPTAYGILILLWTPMALMLFRNTGLFAARELTAYLIVTVCFGGLGLIDDLYGNRSAGGLMGHFRRLVIHRQITTGLLKAAGGIAVGILTAHEVLQSLWPEAFLSGMIIALSANAINLLDLRPGRACAAFFVVAAFVLGLHLATHETLSPLWLVVIPALAVYERDARGMTMMGDTGSNLLGAAMGVGILLAAESATARLAILGALIALHILAERASITNIIESNVLLKRIDSWTGRRG
jgi:UDP-N-acetylmuramyl pentapeptide phosphotransferase/UDP-N-acetylglucosamine-1-phosphate transferase